MKKTLSILLIFFLFGVNAQHLVSSSQVGSTTSSFILGITSGLSLEYDVDMYKIIYNTVDALGQPTIAALKIVNNPFKKDLLIADFGTILSITKLNSNGSIIGGQLIPGFLTQLKSIEQNTKNLKVPEKYDIPIKDFLIDTEEAILKGVINSLTGVINSLFNPAKDILVICGGDSGLLIKSLKTRKGNIINAPNLVMEGMIIHHLSAKNLF